MLLWRLERGLSQAALAQKAGIPRPNLSDIERGEREVSLKTLRALAYGLGLRPGVLADGVGPQGEAPPLTRQGLEGIAKAVADGTPPPKPGHKGLAQKAALLGGARRRALRGRGKQRIGRKAERAWLSLRAQHDPREVESLLNRIAERQKAGNGK